jgi:hypothetical protein
MRSHSDRATRKSTSKRKDDMPGRAISLHRKTRSFCYYGRSGTGKTTLFATHPKDSLLLDIRDEGTDSISDVKGVEARELEEWDEFEEMYWWLRDHPKEFATVGIDTVTQLQKLGMRHLIGDKGRGGKVAGDWGSMTKRDWGDLSALLNEWIINYRDLTQLGMEVVFLAQDRTSHTDEDEEIDQLTPEVGPALSPAVAKNLCAAVSVLGQCFVDIVEKPKEGKGRTKYIKKTEYCLRLGPHPIYGAKIRKPKSSGVPGYIVDPSYDDIMAIIRGE